MDFAFALACVVLAGVFAVAAVAKLADRNSTPDAVRAFGVPSALVGPVATLLPVVELIVAVLLLIPTTSVWGGLGALVLLGAFIVAISASLARGKRPACHCFGQVHSAPVGWPTVVRNVVLAAAAGFVVLQARGGEPPSIARVALEAAGGRATPAVVALLALAVIGAQGWLLLHLLRQHGRLLLRIDTLEATLRDVGLLAADAAPTTAGLSVGAPAPAFELPALSGGQVSLAGLIRDRRPSVLVFTEPGCHPCAELLPELGRWARQHAEAVSLVVVTRGITDTYRRALAAAGTPTVAMQRDREVAEAFGAVGTPSAVLLEGDGTIGSALATGAVAIRDLLARALEPQVARAAGLAPAGQSGAPTVPIGAPPGTMASPFGLPDLEGRVVDSASFRGRTHALLFWNPECGFCRQMLPDLRAWERRDAEDGPALILISTGTIEANRALGLRSRVLLDPRFTVGSSLGIQGTPSAALLDVDGTLLAPIAVGAPQVFATLAAARAGEVTMAETGSLA